MADIPTHVVTTRERHEWTIGDGDGPLTARQLRDGIFFAQQDMEKLNINTSYDDAYEVIADGYQIILRVEVGR